MTDEEREELDAALAEADEDAEGWTRVHGGRGPGRSAADVRPHRIVVAARARTAIDRVAAWWNANCIAAPHLFAAELGARVRAHLEHACSR
jgi:hypothetical protein